MTSLTRRHFGLALFGALVAGCGEEQPVAVIRKGDAGSRPELKGREEAEIKAKKKAGRGKSRG